MEWRGRETSYRVVDEVDAAAPQAPVVICHGGPGAALRGACADRRDQVGERIAQLRRE